jgi:hypothetical protein
MFLFIHFYFQLEEKEKKDQEEAERQRLEELQTKTPEVTITVVNSSGLHGVSSNSSLSSRQSNSVRGNKNSKKANSVSAEHRNDSKEEGGCVSREDAATHVTSSDAQQPPQMVTIKRVMEGNGNEPTVTITLKGATPDKDKVLFTLVNGQGDYRTSNKFIFTLTCRCSICK